MAFSELPISPALLRNLGRLGYLEPTPIQAQAVPVALEGRDLLGIARTGSGKTAAFLLPLLERLLRRPVTRGAGLPQAVVLCPTRELALQVGELAEALASGSRVRVATIHGKVALTPQVETLARGIEILVGTPGRIRELLDAEALRLAQVRQVVLDEADRMLDLGFEPQVRAILAGIPSDRQTLLFTATMPTEVEALADSILRRPVRLEIDPSAATVEHIRQRRIDVADEEKVPLLRALLAGADTGAPRRGVLVFCRTRRRAHWIGTALARHGAAVGYLHGDRSHAQRTRALQAFAAGKLDVLVATDVAARGLHVPAVRTVINYDIALAPEEHVHRVGRAAHGLEGRGGSGEALSFVAPEDRPRWERLPASALEMCEPMRRPAIAAYLEGVPPRSAPRDTAARSSSAPARGGPGGRRTKGGTGRSTRATDAVAPERYRRSRKSRPGAKTQRRGKGCG